MGEEKQDLKESVDILRRDTVIQKENSEKIWHKKKIEKIRSINQVGKDSLIETKNLQEKVDEVIKAQKKSAWKQVVKQPYSNIGRGKNDNCYLCRYVLREK